MRYIIHTRESVKRITPLVSFAIISVRTPTSERVPFMTNPQCQGILELAFDDLDSAKIIPVLLVSTENDRSDVILFDEAMADAILDFWLAHAEIEELYVHCDGGWSRSPAIAAALQKIATNDDEHWFKTKRPNMLVYRTLLNRAYARGLISNQIEGI